MRLPGIAAGSRNVPLVIDYHRVVEDFAAAAQHTVPAMLISAQMLERQLDWIGRRFHFVSLDELASQLERGERFNRPVAAITFDDGYRDVYDNAFPLLKRKGIPAGVFVVTGLIGAPDVHIHDKLYLLLAGAFSRWRPGPREVARFLVDLGIRLPEIARIGKAARTPTAVARAMLDGLPQVVITRVIDGLERKIGIEEGALRGLEPLTWEMLAEMQSAGMTIGSHTKTHALLTNESRQKVLDETAGSRRALESRLGITIDHFSYPSGRFDRGVVSAVAAAGYRFGYTTCEHRERNLPLLTVPRKVFWQNTCLDAFGRFSTAMMSCQVAGMFNFLTPCRQDHTRSAVSAR